MRQLQGSFLKCGVPLFWVTLLFAFWSATAQTGKAPASSGLEEIPWGLTWINLDIPASELFEADQVFVEALRELRGALPASTQLHFKTGVIHLRAPKNKRATKRYNKKIQKYLEEASAASRYFMVIVLDWDKEGWVQNLHVHINLPEDLPTFESYSKKEVEHIAEDIFKKSMWEAGKMAPEKKKN